MTRKQRIEHKIGNQVRKLRLQQLARSVPEDERSHWANLGLCQDGRHTRLPALERLRAAFITPAPHPES
jgi:hypothetical protein